MLRARRRGETCKTKKLKNKRIQNNYHRAEGKERHPKENAEVTDAEGKLLQILTIMETIKAVEKRRRRKYRRGKETPETGLEMVKEMERDEARRRKETV